MNKAPGNSAGSARLSLRDELAVDRTLLANERTLLAYLRSGVALSIAGVTIVHFAEQDWFHWFGVASIPAGIIALVTGAFRYRKMRAHIRLIQTEAADRSDETSAS